MKTYSLFTDGGSRGNPGPAATGYTFLQQGKEILYGNKYIDIATNNTAEYLAFIEGLQALIDTKELPQTLNCYLDSELVVKQLNGIYKIKQPHIKDLATQAFQKLQQLRSGGVESITISHVPRNQNKRADQLVNIALDENK